MTLLLMEGWDNLNAISDKYTGNFTYATLRAGDGRFGGKCARIYYTTGTGKINIPVPSAPQTVFIGCAVKITAFSGTTIFPFSFLDSVSQANVSVGISSTGALGFYTTLGVLIGSVSSNTLPANTWCFIEIKIKIADSITTNDCIIKVNGVEWVNLSSGDTRYGTYQLNVAGIGITWNNIDSSNYLYVDDLYVLDGAGSTCNTFLGDSRIDYLSPNGNGTTNNFVGSDSNSTDNYLLVDELVPDGADYVGSATPNDIDLYALPDLSQVPSTVHAVQVENKAVKDVPGQRTYANLVRSGGTNYPGATKSVGYPDASFNQNIWETNPAGGAWDAASLSALEIGVKIIA